MAEELYTVEDGWMETFRGNQFFFKKPFDYQFSDVEISHSLSMQCRYGGHTQRFYSVAEHCCLISDWLLMRGLNPWIAYTGLHHDDAEAYIGDIPRPLKHMLPQFKAMEETIDLAVSAYYRTIYPFPPIIKEADSRILVDERRQAMSDSDNDWGTDGLEPLGVNLRFWSPEVAASEWFARHCQLSDELEFDLKWE
jgi:hypothetical protein